MKKYSLTGFLTAALTATSCMSFPSAAQVNIGTLTVQVVRAAGTCEMTVTSDYGPTGQTYTVSSEMSFSTTVDTSGPELYIEIVTEDGTPRIGDIPVE